MPNSKSSAEPTSKHSYRPAAVAGSFYPGDVIKLNEAVHKYITSSVAAKSQPKALIVPHAGYIYSGHTAGSAYALLKNFNRSIKTVVLLGPAHRVYVEAMAIPSVYSFSTPMGNVPLDQLALKELTALRSVEVSDLAHRDEHSLEVQLPFLQSLIDDFQLVPIVVGNAATPEVANVLKPFYGKPDTLVVISSDLSHYHTYDEAKKIDAATCESILNKNINSIKTEGACGAAGIRGLLQLLIGTKPKIDLLDLKNSGDTAGPQDQVVGYASFAFY